jgi:hypothetical protein
VAFAPASFDRPVSSSRYRNRALSRSDREVPRPGGLEGPVPRGTLRDGLPAPRRLGKPSLVTSPISGVSRRRPGTPRRLPDAARSWCARDLSRGREPTLTGATRYRAPSSVRRAEDRHRNAFVVSRPDGLPRTLRAPSAFESNAPGASLTPSSPPSSRAVRQHLRETPAGLRRVAPWTARPPGRARRTMRRTDFCLLDYCLRAPAPHRFQMCGTPGDASASRQTAGFGGPPSLTALARGGAAEPLTPPCFGALSGSRRAPRDRRASKRNQRMPCPSNGNPHPATPFRAPGSGFRRRRGFATAPPAFEAIFTRAPFGGTWILRSPSAR